MAKKVVVENRLYVACLDARYADMLNADIVNDLTEQLKEVKSNKRKSKKVFEKAVSAYIDLYGKEPDFKGR